MSPRDHAQACSLLGGGRRQGTGLSSEARSRALEKRAEAAGPLEGPRPAVVEAACTWAHPPRFSGCQEAADHGSAQALVQVGRGEECVGGQAHGQEAPDHGGAKMTSPTGGLLGAPSGGGVHHTGGLG